MALRRLPGLAMFTTAVLALATGCGGGGDSPSDATGEYQWGINAELSGPGAFYGKTIEAGVKAYVDQVNAAGGINGHKITLTSLDNAGDAARAAANATQLATANSVNAIFGHAFSATCASATTVVERYKVPTACLSVAEPNKYIYNLGPANARAAGPMLEAAKTLAGTANPTVAVVYVNTLTSTKLGQNIEAAAPGAGVTVVTTQEIDSASADPSVQVARIVDANPQVILITHTGPGFVAVMRGVRAAGLTAPVVWADGTNLGFVSDFTDDNAYALSVYRLVAPDASGSAAVEYIEAIKPTLSEVTGATLNSGDTVLGYMSARAFGEALKQCGYPCTGEQLQGVLDGLKAPLDGLEADYRFAADDHYPFPNWYLYKFRGEETTLVESYPTD